MIFIEGEKYLFVEITFTQISKKIIDFKISRYEFLKKDKDGDLIFQDVSNKEHRLTLGYNLKIPWTYDISPDISVINTVLKF